MSSKWGDKSTDQLIAKAEVECAHEISFMSKKLKGMGSMATPIVVGGCLRYLAAVIWTACGGDKTATRNLVEDTMDDLFRLLELDK